LQEQIENIDIKKDVLGIEVLYSSYEEAHNEIYKVTNVVKDGPAFGAGFSLANDDYVIAGRALDGPLQRFEAVSTFAGFVHEHDGKEIDLYVYNCVQEQTRAVRITPKSDWGGQGLLGCDVVHGAFHGIPSRKQNLWGEKASNQAFVRAKGAFNLEELDT
jgi:hypothetical protein